VTQEQILEQGRAGGMMWTIRLFLLVEGIGFVLAGLVHFGVLASGYEDSGAAVPESVIGAVLLAGLALTWALPARTRGIGIAVQAFALLGTLVGAYLSVIGIGPDTVPDVVFHFAMLIALIAGLVVATRGGRPRGETARTTAVAVVQTLIRAIGVLQLALGLAFWTGTLLVAVPFHMLAGMLFVVLLWAQAGLAAWAGASWRLAAGAVVWGVVVVALGMTQTQLLPGDWHWIVEVAHLLVGLAAIGLGERLAAAAKSRLQGGATGATGGGAAGSDATDRPGRAPAPAARPPRAA
jgi:hypothetical protein